MFLVLSNFFICKFFVCSFVCLVWMLDIAGVVVAVVLGCNICAFAMAKLSLLVGSRVCLVSYPVVGNCGGVLPAGGTN